MSELRDCPACGAQVEWTQSAFERHLLECKAQHVGNLTPEQESFLLRDPPQCPTCKARLPGIKSQQDLATFLRVRCANYHFWARRV